MEPTHMAKLCYEVILTKEPFIIFIDVGLLSENQHKIKLIADEDLLFNEGVVPLLWITSYTASLNG